MHNEQIIHEINKKTILQLFMERGINTNRNQSVFVIFFFSSECISLFYTLEGRAAGGTINGEKQHNQSEIGLSVCALAL